MTIRDLFILCANFGDCTNVRVFNNEYEMIFQGHYHRIPETMKELKISSFDFDNDLSGCLINTLPA